MNKLIVAGALVGGLVQVEKWRRVIKFAGSKAE